MSKPDQDLDNPMYAGQVALASGAWREARACFEEALRNEETPEALDGLGMAGWGLSETALTFDTRERAYRLYKQRGDYPKAARVAARLAIDHLYYRGENIIAGGWVQRARTLLADLAPTPALGWLDVTEAQILGSVSHEVATIQKLCYQAKLLGKSFGVVDLEMLALAQEGLTMVLQGQVSEGMRRLDESTTAIAAGETTDIDASCVSCCALIFACEITRDFERAAQWIEHLRAIAARWSHPSMFYFCRVHYAGYLIWTGNWAEAESELLSAITELEATQPALAAEAFMRLAVLYCRQGRFDEASVLFERADSPPYRVMVGDYSLLGRAGMAFARNYLEPAIDLAARFLRAIPNYVLMERINGIELLFQALVMHGDLPQAESFLGEIRAAAEAAQTKPMQASARFAEGMLAMATANFGTAKACFEDAFDLWERCGAPFEAAQGRMGLAQALLALGRVREANLEAQEALQVFTRLRAMPVVAFAEYLIHQIESASLAFAANSAEASGPDLTARELEVLSLIAAGKSNQEIAGELVLSIRTVERHISNIYTKIGATGTAARATATAFAHKHNLSPIQMS